MTGCVVVALPEAPAGALAPDAADAPAGLDAPAGAPPPAATEPVEEELPPLHPTTIAVAIIAAPSRESTVRPEKRRLMCILLLRTQPSTRCHSIIARRAQSDDAFSNGG
ncbi:hypothetical protein BURKHO8Y_10017 [Burkholderia sp. 8Y]|nr:hypothetical protein BURKHO8Y_10017 [Burkholderia sp. 8Y]